MIKTVNLSNEIFGPVDLKLDAGQSLVVRGGSGSGKTRFMRGVADLDETSGEVFVDGAARGAMPAYEWRQQVRFVPAESYWWFERVGDHFQISDELFEKLEALGLGEKHLAQSVSEVSTGERQRLAFLRAIADQPKVLLLDEPTSALDTASTDAVERLIEQELHRGASILIASHSEEQALRFGPHCLTFNAGRAVVGELPDILSDTLEDGFSSKSNDTKSDDCNANGDQDDKSEAG